MTTVHRATSLEGLLTGLIDYAGLFPPAGLAMKPASENFAAYRRLELSWILGRFICPTGRLGDLEACLASVAADDPWPISALIGKDVAGEIKLAQEFNQRQAGRAVVDTVEFKAESADAIRRAAELIPGTMMAYCEIPVANDPRELIAAISTGGVRAKIRTGGVSAAAFPTSAQVACFVMQCAEASVPFKATAGLHHPLRGEFRLTYESESARAAMHGFLNVFLAAGFARDGWNASQLVPLLEEADAAAFQFHDDGARWREHSLTTDAIQNTRRQFATAFGSCSFEEPVRDLKALGLL